MLFEAVILSIVLGYLLGGSIQQLGDVKIHRWWLVLIAFVIELVGEVLLKIPFASDWVFNNTWIFMLLQYSILLWFIYENWSIKAIKIFYLGTILNFFVIMANGGFMPVTIEMAKNYDFSTTLSALEGGKIFAHIPASGETVLKVLGDIFHLPPPYIYPQTFSLGDVIIDVAVMLFIINTMISGDSSEVSV